MKYEVELKCVVYIPIVIEANSEEDANKQIADAIQNKSFDMDIISCPDCIDRYVLADIVEDFDPDATKEYEGDE